MGKNINVAYDWLNMFTKVSERLYLAFFVKMGKTRAQQDRANELRRIEKSKRRQAYFIADYIQVKYFNLYSEAANFFYALNTLYPTKYDIRKTGEYRSWRMELTTGQRTIKAKPPTYENIAMSTNTYCQNTDQQPESHELSEPQSPESEPQSPESEPQSPECHPKSPQSDEQLPESEPQSPQSDEQLPESEPQSPENDQQLSEKEPVPWKDNMELKIPFLEYIPSNPRNSEPSVTTQTIEIITEQTLDQSNMDNNPSNQLIDASINESIDQIIRELRQDPELHSIFNEIELSEGIDIEEDIRLENELLTW